MLPTLFSLSSVTLPLFLLSWAKSWSSSWSVRNVPHGHRQRAEYIKKTLSVFKVILACNVKKSSVKEEENIFKKHFSDDYLCFEKLQHLLTNMSSNVYRFFKLGKICVHIHYTVLTRLVGKKCHMFAKLDKITCILEPHKLS